MTGHPPHDDICRREMLRACSTGFGMVALSALLGRARGAQPAPADPGPHFPPRARSVIFCYMSGGVSHVDSLDPKPRLERDAGKPMPMKVERTQFNQNGTIRPSYWKYRRYGESGLEVSDLFPRIGAQADSLAVVRSMTAPFSEHAQGNYFMHTGFPFLGHPSAGAWTTYGLGRAADNLPGFVVLRSGGSGVPHGGVGLFSNGFLPADHQGSLIDAGRRDAVPNIVRREPDGMQRRRLRFLKEMDRKLAAGLVDPSPVNAAISNYETAYGMQAAVPDLIDLRGESDETRALYGIDAAEPKQAAYARQCLLARRLVERGVRFVELTTLAYNVGGGNGANPWDQHSGIEDGHGRMARQVDQPIAALIEDLRRRGLLDETLVIWAGEFGRTPFSQGSNGRDHNPFGFSIWMAGGGVKGGTTFGATDEYGYHAVENPCTVYDLWATVLHQLGLRHQDLTYRHGGRDYRLTDVHGNVLHDILD